MRAAVPARRSVPTTNWRTCAASSDSVGSAFFADSVDPVLRVHLEVWLFRTRQGPHSYGSEPLQPHNTAKMARKARSILYEKHPAAALDACGAEFFDLNELTMPQKIQRKIDDKLFDFTHWRSGLH